MAKKLTEKQKRALAKGQKNMKLAQEIQKKAGTKTIPAKKVYVMNMNNPIYGKYLSVKRY
jgi:hypothetical protein